MDRSIIVAMGAVLASSACTDTGTLRIDGRTAEADRPQTDEVRSALVVGESSLEITRARIAVSEVELEGGGEDEREAEMGGAVIDLDVSGEPTTFAVEDVEAGSYHTLGLAFTRRDFAGESASIVVEGSYESEEFVFRSRWTPEAEFPLRPEVDVPPQGEATVSVAFDLSAWFTDGDGDVIDPTASDNRSRIESRVIASISAAAEIELEDDDDD